MDSNTNTLPQAVERPALRSGDLLALLNEAYVFIAMKHRACDPWRKALDDWQDRVEKQTGWRAFDQIENSRANETVELIPAGNAAPQTEKGK